MRSTWGVRISETGERGRPAGREGVRRGGRVGPAGFHERRHLKFGLLEVRRFPPPDPLEFLAGPAGTIDRTAFTDEDGIREEHRKDG